MKFIVKSAKPRNPFAVAVRLRRCGTHRRSAGALRRRAGRELQRALDDERQPCP